MISPNVIYLATLHYSVATGLILKVRLLFRHYPLAATHWETEELGPLEPPVFLRRPATRGRLLGFNQFIP